MRKTTIAAGLMMMAGCAPVPPAGTGAAPEARVPDTCGAASYAGLLGQDAAAAAAVPQPMRVVRPGDIVTSDYLPNRVNIGLDARDRIIELGCG